MRWRRLCRGHRSARGWDGPKLPRAPTALARKLHWRAPRRVLNPTVPSLFSHACCRRPARDRGGTRRAPPCASVPRGTHFSAGNFHSAHGRLSSAHVAAPVDVSIVQSHAVREGIAIRDQDVIHDLAGLDVALKKRSHVGIGFPEVVALEIDAVGTVADRGNYFLYDPGFRIDTIHHARWRNDKPELAVAKVQLMCACSGRRSAGGCGRSAAFRLPAAAAAAASARSRQSPFLANLLGVQI